MKKLLFETYLQTIRNSCGSRLFRNLYVEDDLGEVIDVLENGNLSCAMFVSSILAMFGKINARHGTVSGTIEALPAAGWTEVSLDEIQAGDILVWEKGDSPVSADDPYRAGHSHIGFFMGDQSAISNSSENGFPILHSYNYHGTRKLVQAFHHTWPSEDILPSSISQFPSQLQ